MSASAAKRFRPDISPSAAIDPDALIPDDGNASSTTEPGNAGGSSSSANGEEQVGARKTSIISLGEDDDTSDMRMHKPQTRKSNLPIAGASLPSPSKLVTSNATGTGGTRAGAGPPR